MADDEREVWRARFIDYYRQNAPDKVRLVTDKMLDKFAGRYDELMDNIIAKYGPPGQPHARAPAPAPRSDARDEREGRAAEVRAPVGVALGQLVGAAEVDLPAREREDDVAAPLEGTEKVDDAGTSLEAAEARGLALARRAAVRVPAA